MITYVSINGHYPCSSRRLGAHDVLAAADGCGQAEGFRRLHSQAPVPFTARSGCKAHHAWLLPGVLLQLATLGMRSTCSVHKDWFDAGGPHLSIRHVNAACVEALHSLSELKDKSLRSGGQEGPAATSGCLDAGPGCAQEVASLQHENPGWRTLVTPQDAGHGHYPG